MIIRPTYITEEGYKKIQEYLESDEYKERIKDVRKMMEDIDKRIAKIGKEEDE